MRFFSTVPGQIATLLVGLLAAGSVLAQIDVFNSTRTHPDPLQQDQPIVLELSGQWSDSCVPGFAVTSVAPDRVIVEDVRDRSNLVCATVITPYRLVLNTRGLTDDDWRWADEVEFVVRYADTSETFSETTSGDTPEPDRIISPGLYRASALANQGLVATRQDDNVLFYPLLYDAEGDSRWFFASGQQTGNVIFADLLALSGGQCLDCPPPSTPPDIESAGTLTALLREQESGLDLQLNDGPFIAYEPLLYGYRQFHLGPGVVIPDLSGQWAYRETLDDPNAVVCPDDLVGETFSLALRRFRPSDQSGDEDAVLQFDVTPSSRLADPPSMVVDCRLAAFLPGGFECALVEDSTTGQDDNREVNANGLFRLQVESPQRIPVQQVANISPFVGACGADSVLFRLD